MATVNIAALIYDSFERTGGGPTPSNRAASAGDTHYSNPLRSPAKTPTGQKGRPGDLMVATPSRTPSQKQSSGLRGRGRGRSKGVGAGVDVAGEKVATGPS